MTRESLARDSAPLERFSALPDREFFAGKSILVTGGTGSFGQAFAKAVLRSYSPDRLIVFSRDELKQFEMQQDAQLQAPCMRYFIGDVRDRDRLAMALRGVDYVIHAAAMKQIPAAEYNPFECIQTNVHGAENVVQAAIQNGVRRVVALSTDKAANPINLYGASKLASDKIFIAANNLAGRSNTRFSVVRYGNVVGSRGSIVPYFQRLVAEGAKELPITDERMTRFWITLQQGVNFVLRSLETMSGGEVFVPRIPSMGVLDLCNSLWPDMKTRIVGIRAGEKLHEVMVPQDEARSCLETDDSYIIEPQFAWWSREPYMLKGARPVAEDFLYASNVNTEWLDAEGIRAIVGT